jgi:hypothetical protein
MNMSAKNPHYAEVLLSALLCSATMLAAQPVNSPEIHPDGSVRFRLLAPAATKAEVHLELASGMSTLAMSRDASHSLSFRSRSSQGE